MHIKFYDLVVIYNPEHEGKSRSHDKLMLHDQVHDPFPLTTKRMIGTVFQKENSCLHKIAEPSSKVPRHSTVIHLWGTCQRLQITSYSPLISEASLDLLEHMAQQTSLYMLESYLILWIVGFLRYLVIGLTQDSITSSSKIPRALGTAGAWHHWYGTGSANMKDIRMWGHKVLHSDLRRRF